jgi:integrase
VRYRHRGRERKQYARTYDEARSIKQGIETDKRHGEHHERATLTFEDYAKEWIDTYTGRTSRGFRESTRAGYRYSIEHRAIPYFSKHTTTLAGIEPRDIRSLIAELFKRKVAGKPPAVSTVRGHVAAVKVLLATAVEDGLIRHNPASGVRIARPGTPVLERDAAEQRRALDSDELARFLKACPAEWELFFRLLAMAGIRIGEAVELRWKDVDFGAKRLRVRRALYLGQVSEPKSKHGKRDVPLSRVLARELWSRQGKPDELIFTTARTTRVDRDNVWKQVLKPTAKAAGVPWVGFHTFRHTCASVLFASGKNPKQVQMWLGHADPGFTLRTYVHLIDDGLGDADFLDAAKWATNGPHEPREQGPKRRPGRGPENRLVAGQASDPSKAKQTQNGSHNRQVAGSSPAAL